MEQMWSKLILILEMHNTEDKNWWCLEGIKLEEKFIDILNSRFGIKDAIINPSKFTDKYAPDLLINGNVVDLKTQNTPFFTASRYCMNPRFTVTFNRKDYERYLSKYPNISVFFWIEWRTTKWKDIEIDYLGGIYGCKFKELKKVIESEAPEHFYQKRVDDTSGNAKSSFLLDTRRMTKFWETKNNIK